MPSHEPHWLWIEDSPEGAADRPLMIRHPSNPFIRAWTTGEIFPVAFEYLREFAAKLRLPPAWIDGLDQRPLVNGWRATRTLKLPPDEELTLRWFPFDGGDPRSSFWCRREQGNDTDLSAALLAGLCHRGKPPVFLAGLRLRVVVHVAERRDGREARFTGMSRSHGESQALELQGAAVKAATKPSGGKPAAVYAAVFRQDPASRTGTGGIVRTRPSRSSDELDPERSEEPLGDLPVSANRADLTSRYVEVRSSYLLPADAPVRQPRSVPVVWTNGRWLVDTRSRSKDSGAVNAYFHGRSMFARMASSGLDPGEYFRCAELPVHIHYRSGIARAPDDRVRNADTVWDRDALPDVPNGKPGRILVRFALADLALSPGRHPLGLGCDVRWNWHEFGHVLLMAAVGEREFRFAHSAGDALGAILCDPESQLARPEHDGGWRGVTFPWVMMKRRHDRRPGDGWAWGGVLDRSEKGYWKEQILSSTLFRLYRALGGDATDGAGKRDQAIQFLAADYAAYLIMRAIKILGAAEIVAASTPDQFVSALIDADVGTSLFTARNGRVRVGGTAHKVIRWTFEQQGLYAPPGRTEPVHGPGDAAAVDLYVASDLSGGYAADPATYRIVAPNPVLNHPGNVQVTIGNRGAARENTAKVELWAARKTPDVPDWKQPLWTKVGEQAAVVPARSPGVAYTFPWTPDSPGRHALLAIATSEQDRANTLAETGFACALNGAPIRQLVGSDNNLGITEVNVSAT